MAKQLKMENPKKIPLNLVQGEFWSRMHKVADGVIKQPAMSKYCELRVIQTPDGVVEKLVEVDYPITPDYVKSFANSADYRNDIESAVNSPVRGQNLGDLTGIQDILAMDLSSVRDMQSKLKLVEDKMLQAQSAQVKNIEEPSQVEANEVKNG